LPRFSTPYNVQEAVSKSTDPINNSNDKIIYIITHARKVII
jgi:hypothetical protein